MNEITQIELKTTLDADGNIIGVEVELPVYARTTDDNYFQVQCPLIRTIGYSTKSLEDALADHDKDVNAFFKVHLKRKTLRHALISLGWKELNNHFNSKFPDFLLQNSTIQKMVATA